MIDTLDRFAQAELLAWSQNRSTGHAMRFIREELGLDRSELASRLGVTPQEVYRLEDSLKHIIPLEIDRNIRALWINKPGRSR